MKNNRKKIISETAAQAMGLGGYSMSNGRGAFDANQRPDMIPSPVDTTHVPVVSASGLLPACPIFDCTQI